MLKKISYLTLLAISCSAIFTANALEQKRTLELSTNGVTELFIDSGAGSLEVKGEKGLNKILVDAHIIIDADDKKAQEIMEDSMKLHLTRKGTKATLKSLYQSKAFFNSNNIDKRIDIKVRIPENLMLEIDDGSGDLSVTNIKADVEVDDGSGDGSYSLINGNLVIDDGSGDIEIDLISGHITIDDGSGAIKIENTDGKVSIIDGSGEIKLRNITQNVSIDDGSGSIYACDIGGNLVIDDGSGSVDTCSNMQGKVTIK